MAKVVAIANQKGGVGKTTICIQMAFYLSLKLDKKVLVIDFDGQGNTSSRLAPREIDRNGVEQVIFSGSKTTDLFSHDLEGIAVTHCPSGVDLIHTPKNDTGLFNMESIPLEQSLNPAKNLKEFIKSYDYVLVDCPPSLGRNLVAALAFTTHVVSPIKLSGFAVDGVEGLLQTILGIKKHYNPNLSIVGLAINDMDRSVNHSRSFELLEQEAGKLLLHNKIMHRPPLDTASSQGIPVWDLPYGHVAAKEVLALLEEIIEKVNS